MEQQKPKYKYVHRLTGKVVYLNPVAHQQKLLDGQDYFYDEEKPLNPIESQSVQEKEQLNPPVVNNKTDLNKDKELNDFAEHLKTITDLEVIKQYKNKFKLVKAKTAIINAREAELTQSIEESQVLTESK